MKIFSVQNGKEEKSRIVADNDNEAIDIAKKIIDVTDAKVTDITEVLCKSDKSLKQLLESDIRGCLAYKKDKGYMLIECEFEEGEWFFPTNRQPFSIALDKE